MTVKRRKKWEEAADADRVAAFKLKFIREWRAAAVGETRVWRVIACREPTSTPSERPNIANRERVKERRK